MEQYTKACIPEILLKEDMMAAQLKLHLDEGGQEYNLSELKDFAVMHNVKTGINEDAIRKMIAHDIYDVFVEIARGKAPVKGKDGYFIYHVQNVEQQTGPKILENGEVEYVHTNEYTIVEEGQLLAEYIPATNGEYGYTIDNKMLSPRRGNNLSPLRGNGFWITDNKYYSLIHGRVEFNKVGMQVTNLLMVKEDVDISYGHIDFDGNVIVRGDVHSGMTLKATGDIEISGHVGDCRIEAGKNITIHQGMQGKFEGTLVAGGEVFCRFIENSQVVAKGNIVARSVLHSKMETQGKIIMEGKDAVVLGGSVHAVQGMELTEAGSSAEIPTVLVAGVLPKTIQRNAELTALVKKVEEEVVLLDKAASVMQRMMQTKVTKETSERRMKIIQAKIIKSTELKKYQDEKISIEALIDSGKNASIIVQDNVYPGCRVEIAGQGIRVKTKTKHVKFVIKEDKIEMMLLY